MSAHSVVRPPASPCTVLFPKRDESRRTICVLGSPRGGTSMVAGLLRRLGVAMGDDVDPANNEDQAFLGHGGRRDLFEAPESAGSRTAYLDEVRGIVEQRNRCHDVWGWKDPLAAFYVEDVVDRLRNPVFVLITRDPGAAAQRETLEEGTGAQVRLLAHLEVTLDAYRRCLDLVRRLERPTLVVSYERALRFPRAVGRSLAAMIGVEAPQGFDAWLDAYVHADRPDGSIELAPLSGLSARTPAIATVLEESARVRREEALPLEIGGHRDGEAADLYAAATKALLEGRYGDGQAHSLEVVARFSDVFPQLSEGPIGLLAHEAAAHGPSLYPDVVCAAFHAAGLSSLLQAAAATGMLYLGLAEAMMAQRLAEAPQDSILSMANYGSCVFHLALAAKVMRRRDVCDRASRDLRRAVATFGPAGDADLGAWLSRLEREVLGADAADRCSDPAHQS